MIPQRLVLIDPPVHSLGLHFTDTKIWACAGCGATIGTGLMKHADDCTEMARIRAPQP